MRFLLVDGIDEVVAGQRITGWKNVAMSEDYLEWHFPGRPILPGMLVLEGLVQLAGWFEAVSSDFESWFLLDRVHSARYYAFAAPGDRVDLRLERLPLEDGARRAFRGESHVGATLGARVEFEGRVIDLAALDERARARRAYDQLRRTTEGA